MKKKVNWKGKLLICSIIITLLGLIPWESWFSIEIRNLTLQNLAYGEVALAGMFLCICSSFLLLLSQSKGFLQRAVLVLFSFVILLGALWWMISYFARVPQWRDKAIFKNSNDYIVVEETTEELLGNDPPRRIIRTSSPNSMFRIIEESIPVAPSDTSYDKGISEITLSNKKWHKVSQPGE